MRFFDRLRVCDKFRVRSKVALGMALFFLVGGVAFAAFGLFVSGAFWLALGFVWLFLGPRSALERVRGYKPPLR